MRSPQELVYSYKLAEKAIGYRYLLGGSLLLDMEEKKTDNSINLIKSLETLTEEIKVRKQAESDRNPGADRA